VSQVAIVLDGVMRKNDQESLNGPGMLLYRALEGYTRVSILAAGDPARVEHFLKINRISEFSQVEYTRESDGISRVARRLAQINRLRRVGHVDFVIEPDPEIAAELVAHGIPALLFAHPQFAIPTWRPDFTGGSRPWDNLVGELDRQLELRAEEELKDKETL
jgi:hypothetical protein